MRQAATISIIDDDASVRDAVENLLSALGYTVFSYGSAADFLWSDNPGNADCVIADINMPAMNGIDLLLRIREEGNSVPFIFITGFPDETMSKRALNAGAHCVLTKPFEKNNLLAQLEAALRGMASGKPGD